MPALVLSGDDVRALIGGVELIDAMEAALIDCSLGRVVQPVRTMFGIDGGSVFGVMPGFVRSPAVLGAKLLTIMPSNAPKGLPTHPATIVLLDPDSGKLLALVDGPSVTELRTAAVSAVSVRYLARTDASRLGILGSGVQARGHIAFLPLVRAFRRITVWSPNADHVRGLVSEVGNSARAAASAEEVVRDADVVVLATSSPAPVIEDAWVQPGTHIVSLGACIPTQREMDPALVARSRLVPDSRAAALKESGDVVQGIREGRFTEDHLQAELGNLAAKHLGRTSSQEITIFKSLGMAVEDLVAAHVAYRKARASGRGTDLPGGRL